MFPPPVSLLNQKEFAVLGKGKGEKEPKLIWINESFKDKANKSKSDAYQHYTHTCTGKCMHIQILIEKSRYFILSA